MDNVIKLGTRQSPLLTPNLDPYAAALEARIIALVAQSHGSGDRFYSQTCMDRADGLCEARRVYLDHIGQPDQYPVLYLSFVNRAVGALPGRAQAKLFHPSRSQDRLAQQDVLDEAI